MILLIDNYDSFSYNLYQLVAQIKPDCRVVRNDKITIDDIKEEAPEAIILSPGPGRPEDAGVCEEVIKTFYMSTPIFGVCLGHQAICEALGGRIVYAKELMHGKKSEVIPEDTKGAKLLFEGISAPFTVARYHSLAADPGSIPDVLEVAAKTKDGEIMAVTGKNFPEIPLVGLQFHPESVLTPDGKKMMENFFKNI